MMRLGDLDAHSFDQSVQVVDDLLIEAIQLRALLLLQFFIAAEGLQQAGREGSVNPFE